MSKEQSIVASVVVQAPPEAVWEVASDTNRYAEWVENTLQVIRADGPAQPGATYDERTRIAGPWRATTHWRVTEFDPPRRQVHRGCGVATVRDMAIVMELTPTGQHTCLTLTLRYTPRFGAIGAFIDHSIATKVTRAQQRSVNAFAALVAREYSNS